MLKRFTFLVTLFLVTATAQADHIFIYNTTNERMTYEVTYSNGDSKSGEVAESSGFQPKQTNIDIDRGATTAVRLVSESGEPFAVLEATSSRCYVLATTDGGLKIVTAGWNLDNGQTHRREMVIFNGTEATQTFDIIDEKETRKGIVLEPGQAQTFSSKNPFGGYRGYHTLRFADGQRIEKKAVDGDFVLIYSNESRSPGKRLQLRSCGHLAAPR